MKSTGVDVRLARTGIVERRAPSFPSISLSPLSIPSTIFFVSSLSFCSSTSSCPSPL